MSPTNSSRYVTEPGLRITEFDDRIEAEAQSWVAFVEAGVPVPTIERLKSFYVEFADHFCLARVEAIHARILALCNPSSVSEVCAPDAGLLPGYDMELTEDLFHAPDEHPEWGIWMWVKGIEAFVGCFLCVLLLFILVAFCVIGIMLLWPDGAQ